MFRIILVLTFLGPLNAAVFRVGWLSSSCLTFSAAGARDMTQNTLNVGQLDVKVTGSGNTQGTSGVRSVDTLAKYIDMSWGMLLKRIKEEGLLEGHTLELISRNTSSSDGHCSETSAMRAAYELIDRDMTDVVVGPVATSELIPVGYVSATKMKPHLAFGSASVLSAKFADSKTFSSMLRISATADRITNAITTVFENNAWTRIGIMSTADSTCAPALRRLMSDIAQNRAFDVTFTRWYDYIPSNKMMFDDLAIVKQTARIVIFCFDDGSGLDLGDEADFRFLTVAQQVGMATSEYIFARPHPGFSTNIERATQNLQKMNNAEKNFYLDRIVGDLGLGDESRSSQTYVKPEWYLVKFTLGSSKTDEDGTRTKMSGKGLWQMIGAHFYDAVYLYARTIDSLLLSGKNPKDLRSILAESKKQIFEGMTGLVQMDQDGIRYSNITMYDLNKAGDRFEEKQMYNGVDMKWEFTKRFSDGTGGASPDKTPECGFGGELCKQEDGSDMNFQAKVIITALFAGFCVCGIGLGAYVLNRRMLVTRLERGMWRIALSDIQIIRKLTHRSFTSASRSLGGTAGGTSSAGSFHSSDQGTGSSAGSGDSDGEGDTTSRVSKGSKAGHSENLTITSGALLDGVLRVGRYGDQIVVLKPMPVSLTHMNADDKAGLVIMRKLQHTNICVFFGTAYGDSDDKVNAGGLQGTKSDIPILLLEYCERGSLRDVLENEVIKLDAKFKVSLTSDITEGLNYLHNSPIKLHGRLKTSNVVIDKRWVAKLTDYGLLRHRADTYATEIVTSLPLDQQQEIFKGLTFSAPEVLRLGSRSITKRATGLMRCFSSTAQDATDEKNAMTTAIMGLFPAADVYSFGLVVFELLTETEAFQDSGLTPKDIVNRVKAGEAFAFRPALLWDSVVIHGTEGLDEQVKRTLVLLTKRCWEEKPSDRPNMKDVQRELAVLTTQLYGKKFNLFERILHELEKYTANLEEVVTERTKEVEAEKTKTDKLLQRMLPKPVAERLKAGIAVEAEGFDEVSIYFSDVVSFTTISSKCHPMQVTAMLNALWSLLDGVIEEHDAYKVETIGDAYMVASGIPIRNGHNHVKEICDIALKIRSAVADFTLPHNASERLQMRIGMHTGPVAAGVVGLSMPHYCLFGEAVIVANIMEQNALPQTILMSIKANELLNVKFSGYRTEESDREVMVKGEPMKTYWLHEKVNFQWNQYMTADGDPKGDLFAAAQADATKTKDKKKK